MDNDVKKIIAILCAGIIVFVMIYGSYLPLRKAQGYINSLRQGETREFASAEELLEIFKNALAYPSPIGQEELVRNTANSMLGFVQRETRPEVIRAFVTFTDESYAPIIARNKGMSFGQDLYLLGIINEIAFLRTKDPSYLGAARKYFLLGSEMGPNRPQPLYGLLDVARIEGNVEAYRVIAERILALWPNDIDVKTEVDNLKKQLTGKK